MFFVSTSWRQSVEWVLDLKVQVCKCLVKSNIHVWWINRKWSALINGFKHGNKNTFIAHSSNIEYGFLWVLTFFIPWRWLFKDIDYYVKIHDVWHCMYHEPYCNVYINQRDAQILVNSLNLFFVKWLYMFQTIISPSSGATFNKLYRARPGTSDCCMARVY